MEAKIRQFIVDTFLAGKDDPDFGNDDSLLDTRILDSTGMVELVEFVEDEFGVTVDDSELTPENLDSVMRVAAFVGRKVNAG
ncbi:MAG: acyl carrier protein [Candidatus Krumholzibacteriota bacterium]|nr:acyl carrier protein [Candidatus Krumholzibacteriota bacterium]